MRKILVVIVITVAFMLAFNYFQDKKESKAILKESSSLIQEQLKNVSKLIVTEGHYSKVYTYKNSKALFANLYNVEKDRKSTRLNSSHVAISYAVLCLKKKN